MKSLLLTLAFLLSFLLTARTQSCLPDGITFTTQGQIDSFPINYPGCTEIEGDVVISNGNYSNLDGLKIVQRINGDLNIHGEFDNYDGLVTLIEVNGSIDISFFEAQIEFDLPNLKRVGGTLSIVTNNSTIVGFNMLDSIGGDLVVRSTFVSGFNVLKSVKGDMDFGTYANSIYISGFNSLIKSGSLIFSGNPFPLPNFNVGGFNALEECTSLILFFINIDIHETLFEKLKYVDNKIEIYGSKIDSIAFLNSLISVGGEIFISNTDFQYLGSMGNLKSAEVIYIDDAVKPFEIGVIGSEILETSIDINSSKIISISGLNQLRRLVGNLALDNCEIVNFKGLDSLEYIEGLVMFDCYGFENFEGFNNLDTIGYLYLNRNENLTSLIGLESLSSIVESVTITEHPLLSECSIDALCSKIYLQPETTSISKNASGCNSEGEVLLNCGIGKNLFIAVKLLGGFDCLSMPDGELDEFIFQVQSGNFSYIANNDFKGNEKFFIDGVKSSLLTLPEFPTKSWAVCQDTIVVDPLLFGDTVNVSFLLIPLVDCPDLSCNLVLPPFFRGCQVETPMSVSVQNNGTIPAENIKATVVLPLDVMDVVSSIPMPDWTNGDSLFYALGDLDVFESVDIDLIVKTKCDTFLIWQTLCVESFASFDNPCDPDPPIGSIISVHPQCIGDTLVEFTLTNIGDAPTMNDHDYFIIEDEVILKMAPFTLNPMQQMTVQAQADGSTFRMEATKLDNGTLTAAAIEGCGGLNPGLINAYWVDQGEAAYDMDCREVRLAYDPNEKSAVPTGVGPEHLMVANRPIQYTIDFQNTGTDTAYRVLIRDVLPAQLDVSSFRPLFATHDYTWQIYGNDTLEFLFQPIALPDSAASQEGSKGFVTFTIDQLPDLPNGTVIENSANIVFDFNPSIFTNTVTHTIGKLLVQITTSTAGMATWTVWGNPMGETALFKALQDIDGTKRFELTDLSGRIIRSSSFLGNEFVFHRQGLAGGMYFFKITDGRGRVCAGRIVVAE